MTSWGGGALACAMPMQWQLPCAEAMCVACLSLRYYDHGLPNVKLWGGNEQPEAWGQWVACGLVGQQAAWGAAGHLGAAWEAEGSLQGKLIQYFLLHVITSQIRGPMAF